MCPPPGDAWGGGAGTPPRVARARASGVLVASRALARMIAGGVACERWASPVQPGTSPRGRPRPAAWAAAGPAVLAPPRVLVPRPCGAIRARAGSSARRPAARTRHRAGPGVAHTGPSAAAVLRGPRPRLRPCGGCAPLPAGVLGCACLCACSACTPPLLAGVCGVGVCAWAWVSAAPRHFWLGCWGVSLFVCALRMYPATPCLGVGVCVYVCALRFYPATPGWRLWCVGSVLPGTCSCAVFRCVLCALSAFAAPGGRCCLASVCVPWLSPAACLSGVPRGLALVRRASSGQVALRAPVGFPDALVPFRIPGAVAPRFTERLRGARGGRPRTGLFVPAAGPCGGRGTGLAPRLTRSGPRDGVVPGRSLRGRSWAGCAAVICVCGPGQ